MFAGTDQNQMPISGPDLKAKTNQQAGISSALEEKPLESATESDSRQLSLTEQTITQGDTE